MQHWIFQGTHYQAGLQYGTRLREDGVVIESGLTFSMTPQRREFASRCLPLYARYFPQILEELQGVADGQGIPVQTLQAILFPLYCFPLSPHCTCFAFPTGDGAVFGRNSDFLPRFEAAYANCLYQLEGVLPFNGNTTAFLQMEDGVNGKGLAVGLTFVPSLLGRPEGQALVRPGLHAGMLVRYLLERCRTVEEALEALAELPIASSQTLILADASGQVALVECNAQVREILRSQGDPPFVAAVNRFHGSKLQPYQNPPDLDDWRAEERYRTVTAALGTLPKADPIAFAQALLSGKYGFLCQYDRSQGADTVWSVVYDLGRGRVWRAEGNPSRLPFQEDLRMSILR